MIVADLNPRRQGGYLCNALALKVAGVDLTELEFACALKKTVEADLSYDRIQYPAAWAYTKIKPFCSGQTIRREMKSGNVSSIFENGAGTYSALYYKRGSLFLDGYVGVAHANGKNRDRVLDRVVREANKLIQSSLG